MEVIVTGKNFEKIVCCSNNWECGCDDDCSCDDRCGSVDMG